MESTNLHHLHDQPPSSSSCYGVAGTTHSWTPNITLNATPTNLNPNLQEGNPRSSRAVMHKNDIEVPMIQDLGYHYWTSDANSHHLDLQAKEEISVAFPKFSEMLNSPSGSRYHRLPVGMMKNNEHNEKLLIRTGDLYSTNAPNYPNFGMPSRGSYSQIYPSINISNLNQSSTCNSTPISTSLDMTAHSLDLLSHPTDNLSFRLHHMQLPTDRSSCSNSTNPSPAETKRPCTLMESKTSQSQTASKKSRLESRPSCPPIKVRKEKLGDRIAALQQLVAPFGKTDTASVLLEAIGYIKFLQGQVETLSVPYMKSSQNPNNRVMQGGSASGDVYGEPKQDLRSRGLCLVPLSCMSYIAGDGGSEGWQQPNFGGAT